MALLLRENDVRSLLTMPDTITVLDEAFRAMAEGFVANQPRTRIILAKGILHMLAAGSPELDMLGCKVYTAFREGVRFVVMLFSASDGRLLAMIEADWLGCMRTGATSALATRYLAREDASVVGLIGAGTQAATQLMGMSEARRLSSVHVYSRTPQNCSLFCDEMASILNCVVRPVASAREAVEMADILITATTASDPVLHGEWLAPGCHINAIGSNWPQRREIDLSTLQRSYLIVTDSREQAEAEAGDFIIPYKEGLFDLDKVYELADVVGGHGPRRSSELDITLYKGLGIALEDIATAAYVYRLARKEGVGEEIPFLA